MTASWLVEWFRRQSRLQPATHYMDRFFGVSEDQADARLLEKAENARAYFERQKADGASQIVIEEVGG